MDDILSTASFGESDRLDAVVRDLNALQARFDALSALLVAKGILTANTIAGPNLETPGTKHDTSGPVTNDELDRLDVKLP